MREIDLHDYHFTCSLSDDERLPVEDFLACFEAQLEQDLDRGADGMLIAEDYRPVRGVSKPGPT